MNSRSNPKRTADHEPSLLLPQVCEDTDRSTGWFMADACTVCEDTDLGSNADPRGARIHTSQVCVFTDHFAGWFMADAYTVCEDTDLGSNAGLGSVYNYKTPLSLPDRVSVD